MRLEALAPVFLALTLRLGAAGEFTIIDVPAHVLAPPFFGVSFTEATGITPGGDIVGFFFIYPGLGYHGFLLSKGAFTEVGFNSPGPAMATFVNGINPEGNIVGFFVPEFPNIIPSQVPASSVLRNGTTIPTDVPGASSTKAFGINAAGDVVGVFCCPQHGFLLSNGTFTAIDVPGASITSPSGINPQREIVGSYTNTGSSIDLFIPVSVSPGWHGFLLKNGVFTTVDVPGGVSTQLFGISPTGEIVGGFLDTNGVTHAFLLSRGMFTTIDAPGAFSTLARGINSRGDIVGVFLDGTAYHGFLLSR
jgi:probable HAF family extracellular repeat protein